MVSHTTESPHGRAWIDASEPAVVGRYSTWTITYTVGELGLDDGGSVMVAFSQTSDMGTPQFDAPSAPNYTSVETDGDADLAAEYDPEGHVRPRKHAVRITVVDGSLDPGETIDLHLGDQAGGSLGVQVQSFPEAEFAFRILVDPHNTEEYVALPEDLTIEIVPGVATDVVAVVSSTAEPGEAVDLGVRAEDYWGNVATGFDGTVTIDAPAELRAPDSLTLSEGTARTTVTPTAVDVYRPSVHAPALEASARANPLVCSGSQDRHTFWGDPHGQSGETVGTGTVREYFHHLVDAAFLDFGAHAANDFQVSEALWDEIKAAGRAVHEPGEFVAFHGYEWSATTALGGDHIVYFRGGDPSIERSSHWLLGPDGQRHEGTRPIEALYEAYTDRDDVLVVPHQGGRPATLDELDSGLTPFLEITSVWGVFEWFAKEAYDREYQIGVVGGSDDHSGRPGTAPPDNLPKHNVEGGLTAARASELTRDALWEAFTGGAVYATTGARILLDVEVEGATMGETVAVEGPPELAVTVHGTAPIRTIDWYRGSDHLTRRDLTEGTDLIEIEWTGARSKFRNKRLDWSGGVSLDRGEITTVEDYGFDHPEEGITRRRPNAVFWEGLTTGNYAGVRLRVDAPTAATLRVGTNQVGTSVSLDTLDSETPHRVPAEGLDAGLTVRRVGTPTDTDTTVTVQTTDSPTDREPYWVRVRQDDGEMAWSSPVYVTNTGGE